MGIHRFYLPGRPSGLSQPAKARSFIHSWETALFGLSTVVYLVTRLAGLARFPIYFFSDEAVQVVLAQDFIRDYFHGYDHVLFPTYFLNTYQYNLGTSVYLQIIPYLLFGKSVFITRAVPVLVSLVAALSVGLILKQIFKSPYPWAAVLLLSITPAWYLHSRTAFETSLSTSFYAGFLYFYMRYRSGKLRSLYWAALCAGLAFYSYSAACAVVGLTALLLFFSDVRYHWRQRMTVLAASGLAALLALPYLRFIFDHPNANRDHLVVLDSYWIKSLPLTAKLGQFFTQYGRGLNPIYWFQNTVVDFPRHVMKGYGYMLWATIPLLVIGLVVMLWKIRQSRYRTLLIALLAAPCGAAMVEIGITRVLTMVIPAAILSAIGLTYLLRWTERLLKWGEKRFNRDKGDREDRRKRDRRFFSIIPLVVFTILAGYNINMLWDTQVNGPLWFADYGIDGMQYGASQIFSEVRNYLAVSPETKIILSPTWANGTDVLARFFFNDPAPFSLGSIQGYLDELKPLDQHTLFIMTPQEFDLARSSAKLQHILVEKTIPYPDGEPGFYLVRLSYADDIAEIMGREQASRRIPQQADVLIGGQKAHVKYSYLDMGDIDMAFDGDVNTLMRSMEANPLKLEISFAQPQRLTGVTVQVGGAPTRVQAILHPLQDSQTANLPVFSQTVPATPDPRPVVLDFGGEFEVSGISLEVENVLDSEPAHVHVWEVTFK